MLHALEYPSYDVCLSQRNQDAHIPVSMGHDSVLNIDAPEWGASDKYDKKLNTLATLLTHGFLGYFSLKVVVV